MRELGVRQSQQVGAVDIRHIDGKRNIADIFTKEIKDVPHFQKMAFTITTPRRVEDMHAPTSSDPIVIEGGVGTRESTTNLVTNSWVPPLVLRALGHAKRLPTAFMGVRAL